MDGLVLCLDGANYKSFKGEATTNYYSTPITLTSGRTGSTDGSIKTSFNTGGPTGGPFTRVVRDTSVSRTTDWEWQIDYSGTGLSNGNSFVVSFYARCPNGTLSSVRLSNPDVEGQTFNIDSTWRRFTASFTYGAQSGLTFFRVNRGHSPFYTNGATYDIANLQVEAKSYSTSFVDGTRGTTVATGGGWKDLVGSNNGELVNGVRESTDDGGSLVFDGVNDYVQKSSATLDLSSGVTMEMIFKSTDMNSRAQGFMQFNAGGYYVNFYTPGNGKLRWETWVPVSTAGGAYYTPTALSNNTWYHAVGTYTNGSSVLYINGSSVASASQTAGTYPSSFTANIRVGQYAGYMSGNIAIAKMYNRALSSAEVKQNFDAHKGRYGL